MSLISLASVRALQEDAAAEGRARPGRIPDAADAQQRIIGQLVAFIPAEPVTLFIAVLAAVGPEAGWGLLVALLTAGALLTVSELREAILRGRPRRAQAAVS